jgi:hypothetical protein
MKKIHYVKAAIAALAVLGAATLAAPGEAAMLSPEAKQILAGVAVSPSPEEQAVLDTLEQVQEGSAVALVNMVRNASDTAILAADLETYAALNPSLMAAIENAVATFVADPRLAPVVAASNCTADVASIHSLVRIWCGLPSLDPYPVVQ